jgi:hypothetical protein
MPWSSQEELLRTKARLVRELRQRTLRRQRQLLFPADDLYSDSDSETEPESKIDKDKPVPLSQYRRDLCLAVICTLLLSITVSLLAYQFLLIRRA